MQGRMNLLSVAGKKEKIIAYIVAVVTASVFLLFFCYEDLKTYTVWSLNLLDVTFEMRIYDFYAYTAQNIHNVTVQYASGDIMGLIPWAIWNIPIWILQYFFKMDICDHPLMMVWSHLFLVFVVLLVFRIFLKVGRYLNNNRDIVSLSGMLFLFSPFVYIAICYSGQTDIMSALLFLLSLSMLFEGKSKGFYFCAMIGFMLKPFFFLSYIAIILLEEKNILKIFAKVLSIYSLNLLYTLIFWNAPMFQTSRVEGPSGRMIQEILGPGIDSVNGLTASTFMIGLILVYFAAYITKAEGEKRRQYIVYFSMLPMIVYFMLVPFEHYRLLILSLVISLTILNKAEYIRVNLILLTILNVSGLICNIAGSSYLFNKRYIAESVLESVASPLKQINYQGGIQSNIMELFPWFEELAMCMAAVFVVAAIIFIVLNRPEQKPVSKLINGRVDRGWVWINYLMILPMLILSLYNI